MKKSKTWHESGELGEDGFWSDVMRAYQDYVDEGIKFSSEDALWQAAKARAQYRYGIARRVDKAKREGKSYWEILAAERAEARRQPDLKIN